MSQPILLETAAVTPTSAGGTHREWAWDTALTGVVPPLITPLTAEGDVDVESMAALVEHILSGGGTGLFVLGGCGEGAWLTCRQREVAVRAAVTASRGRAPVLAGVMHPGTAVAVEAAEQAAAAGADALVVGSPYYFAVDSAAQGRHIRAVLEAVALPVLLYNIPQCTHHILEPDLVAHMAQDRRVLGIKDSAGDFRAVLRLLAIKDRRQDFRVLQGSEHLMAASLLQGVDGLVPGLGNVAPALFGKLVEAARRGDAACARELQAQVEQLWELHTVESVLPALKFACAHVGIGTGIPARPNVPVSAASRARIAAIIDAVLPNRASHVTGRTE